MVAELLQKVNYENKELCSDCGGKCCKRMSGICQPEDFGQPLTEKLLKHLQQVIMPLIGGRAMQGMIGRT